VVVEYEIRDRSFPFAPSGLNDVRPDPRGVFWPVETVEIV
jgi:hypothetical protein